MYNWRQTSGLLFWGGAGYAALEMFWRGMTHWTMALTGGVVFWGLYLLDRRLRGYGTAVCCLAGAGWITGAELLVGLSVNRACGWQVWDYSAEWGNFMGQICPKYVALWFLLCGIAMPLARKSAYLLANPSQKGYNAKSECPEERFLNDVACAGCWKQPCAARRFLRGRPTIRRLDCNRRPPDRRTVRLPAARCVRPAQGRLDADGRCGVLFGGACCDADDPAGS